MKLPLLAVAALTFGIVADGAVAGQSWSARKDFELLGRGQGDLEFGTVGSVRFSKDGARIMVSEPRVRRLTLWTPRGGFVREVAGDGELADFGAPPLGVGADDTGSGFWVRSRLGFARFTGDGALAEMADAPPGALNVQAVLPDRSFFAVTKLPSARFLLGWGGERAPARQAVVRLTRSGEGWTQDTVAVLNMAHMALGVRLGQDPDFPPAFYSIQSFGDFDLMYLDASVGRAGVLRRNLGPGRIELIEVTAEGDTVWHRSVDLPRVPLSQELQDEAVERFSKEALAVLQRVESGRPLAPEAVREAARAAVYLPEFYPAARALIATTFGEVWILTAEAVGGSSVWYSLVRGDNTSAPRRVLLPAGFGLREATPTHAWGVEADPASGARRVVGLRLVAPSSP